MDISIVIPVYNSEKILPILVEKIANELEGRKEYEVILINDHSPDNSWSIIKYLSNNYKFITGINLRKNAGQHNAIMAGLHYSNGDVVVMMDDDLQHSPEYILDLYKKIDEGYDVCYAKFKKRKHKLWKVIGSNINDKMAKVLLGKPSDLYLSSFKALSKGIKEEIITYDGPYVYLDGLILSITDNIGVIVVDHYERYTGEGNYSILKSVSLWSGMATSFSVLPLRISMLMGFIFSFASFFLGLYFIALKIFVGSEPQGWTSLMVVVLFLGGIQLLSLGIIGEYVGRTYLKINRKKQYIIKEVVSGKL